MHHRDPRTRAHTHTLTLLAVKEDTYQYLGSVELIIHFA